MTGATGDPETIGVYVELGARRAFAGSVEWPGWCRSGRDEAIAIEALLAYGPRYAAALRGARLGFRAPGPDASARVLERLKGDATTDFGAPGAAPSADAERMDAADLHRAQLVLRACWRTFDRAAEGAADMVLAAGPRGGGRALDRIVEHVLDADGGYLSRIGVKLGAPASRDPRSALERTRETALESLAAVARDGVPTAPRSGKRWSPRYFVRRVAWHVLDHAWEIEDRTLR